MDIINYNKIMNIEKKVESLNGATAPFYNELTPPIDVGQYCWHDGVLYRCTTVISTAEMWTAAHWTVAEIGEDITDLKNAAIQGLGQNLNSDTGTAICGNDLNNLPRNTVYGLVPYSGLANMPYTETGSSVGGIILTLSKEKGVNATMTQIIIRRGGVIFARQFWGTAYESWRKYMTGEQIESLISDINESVSVATGYEFIRLIPNTQVNTGTSTGVVKQMVQEASSDTDSLIADCSPGDVFLITATGWTSYRTYVFIDSSNTILAMSGNGEVLTNRQIVAPTNAAKIVVNAKRATSPRYVFRLASWLVNKAEFAPTGQNLINDTVSAICSGNANNLPNNNIYGTNISSSAISNMPPFPDGESGTYQGTVITFGKQKLRGYGDMQIFVDRTNGGSTFVRNYTTSWSAWSEYADYTAIKNDISDAVSPVAADVSTLMARTEFAPTNQNLTSSTVASICSGNANNIPNNNIYGINIDYSLITNMPFYPAGVNGTYQGTFITFGKQSSRGYGDMQIYIHRADNGGVYVRNYTSSWGKWKNLNAIAASKILGIGDSICEGWRNNNMGFAGMLGLPYRNLGVTGATLGVASGHSQIASEIENETITEDLVIADGGINDYYFDVPLGTLPTAPVTNDTGAAALDKTTVSGGLSYLLYLIVKKAPFAQRYFLITHKTRNYPYTQCAAGYTQQDLHDRIVAICKLYNVKVIDVYEESVINSEFAVYCSPTAYSSDASVTKQYYVDKDQIHPLWLGYQAGYLPVMLRTIQSAIMT